MEYILDVYKLDIFEVNKRLQLPLHIALLSGMVPNALLILRRGAQKETRQVNHPDEDGLTPVHLGVRYAFIPFMALLLTHGADLNIQSHDGQTPLHHAVRLCGHTSRRVNDYKRDPEKKDSNLTLQQSLVHFLLVNGASTNIRDAYGYLPVQYARNEAVRQIFFSRLTHEEEARSFRGLPTAMPMSDIHESVGLEGGEFFADGHGIRLTIPPRTVLPGCRQEVLLSLLSHNTPEAIKTMLKDVEYLTFPSLRCDAPNPCWREKVQICVSHPVTSTARRSDSFTDLIRRKHDLETVERMGNSWGRTSESCVLKGNTYQLSTEERADWWVPVRMDQSGAGKRVVCTPFTPTSIKPSDGEYTLNVHVHDDTPGLAEEIRIEEEGLSRHKVHPSMRLHVKRSSPDIVLICDGQEELLSVSDVFDRSRNVVPFRINLGKETDETIIELSVMTPLSYKMHFIIRRMQSDVGMNQTAATCHEFSNVDNSSEFNDDADDDIQDMCRKMTVVQYYDLGVALGFSLQQLDMINFQSRKDLAETYRQEVRSDDVIQKSAGTRLVGSSLQSSGLLTHELLKTIWKSIQAATEQDKELGFGIPTELRNTDFGSRLAQEVTDGEYLNIARLVDWSRHYMQLGKELGFHDTELRNIQRKNLDNTYRSSLEILHRWNDRQERRTHVRVSLANVLRKVGLTSVAEKLCEYHFSCQDMMTGMKTAVHDH